MTKKLDAKFVAKVAELAHQLYLRKSVDRHEGADNFNVRCILEAYLQLINNTKKDVK